MIKLLGRPSLFMGLGAAVILAFIKGLEIMGRFSQSPHALDYYLHHDKSGVLMSLAVDIASIVLMAVLLFVTRNGRNYARD